MSGLQSPSRPELSVELVIRDGWFSISADPAVIARIGIKREGGGPHQSKTMMLTELTKAQLVVWRLAQLKAQGTATHVQISMAKRSNVATALDIARTTRDILGGVGILDEHQCFRHLCNLESVKTYEGTDDMHLLILGEKITGIPAFD